jgi:ABC-type glycerol-3-phosphate transport system substrate-binding protein
MWWPPLAALFALVQPPLYKSDDWDKAFPKALVNLITKDGKTYAVLAGIHRGNVLWYNKKLLSRRLKENMFMRTLFLRIKRVSLKEYCPPSPVFL